MTTPDNAAFERAEALVASAERIPLLSHNFEQVGWQLLEAQQIVAPDDSGEPDDPRARALLERATARFVELFFRSGAAHQAADLALGILEREPATPVRARVLDVLARAAVALGDLRAARKAIDDGRDDAPWHALARAELDAAEGHAARGAAVASGAGPFEDGGDEWDRRVVVGLAHLLAGALDEATAALDQAVSGALEQDAAHEMLVSLGLLAVAQATAGQWEAATDSIGRALQLAPMLDPIPPPDVAAPPRGVMLALASSRDASQAALRLHADVDARARAGELTGVLLGAALAAVILELGGARDAALELTRGLAQRLGELDQRALAQLAGSLAHRIETHTLVVPAS